MTLTNAEFDAAFGKAAKRNVKKVKNKILAENIQNLKMSTHSLYSWAKRNVDPSKRSELENLVIAVVTDANMVGFENGVNHCHKLIKQVKQAVDEILKGIR